MTISPKEQAIITSVLRDFHRNALNDGNGIEIGLIEAIAENIALGLWKINIHFNPHSFIDAVTRNDGPTDD